MGANGGDDVASNFGSVIRPGCWCRRVHTPPRLTKRGAGYGRSPRTLSLTNGGPAKEVPGGAWRTPVVRIRGVTEAAVIEITCADRPQHPAAQSTVKRFLTVARYGRCPTLSLKNEAPAPRAGASPFRAGARLPPKNSRASRVWHPVRGMRCRLVTSLALNVTALSSKHSTIGTGPRRSVLPISTSWRAGRGVCRPDAAQAFQFAPPNLCFQSLITPGGNSRLPTPVRRQASGHISSKE